MEAADDLVRTRSREWRPTEIDPHLERRLYTGAAELALTHFANALDRPISTALAPAIYAACIEARNLDLFRPGGIREDGFIALRALAEVVQPSQYVESGVFIGSSLYALHSCSFVARIWAIDPNLSQLAFRDDAPERTVYIDTQDFSEIDFGAVLPQSLVYFDDHINTMLRIVQAHQHGFRMLVFDDSTGFHGITQRLYPAVPTIGMLLNIDALEVGDHLAWYFRPKVRNGRKGLLRKILGTVRQMRPPRPIRVSMTITEGFLEQMRRAQALVDKIIPFPNLFETMPLRVNEAFVDQTKYLVLLKD